MATCKYCGKSGFFLTINSDGLCNKCSYVIVSEVQQRTRIIKDCSELIEKSKNIKTRISRCDLLLEHARELLKYENKGIKTISPLPSQILSEYIKASDQIILDSLTLDVEKAFSKSRMAVSQSTKMNELNKVLIKVQDYKKELKDKTKLNELESKIKKFKHETQLNIYLEIAKKAEFKGQDKKALDQYQEALYFLENDEIDDKLQKDNIGKIEEKISELKKK